MFVRTCGVRLALLKDLGLPTDHNETVKKKLAQIEKEKTIMP